MRRNLIPLILVLLAIAPVATAHAATKSYSPRHLPPAELAAVVGARESGARAMLEWGTGAAARSVELLRNEAANLLLVSGDEAAVDAALQLLQACDQPARQISLEARIVEVDTDRARDLGVDWSRLSASVGGSSTAQREHSVSDQQDPGGFPRQERELAVGRVSYDSRLLLTDALHLLESHGAATMRDIPRVLTLNNRTATILDGTRVTYATRANGYVNMYVADTMDAGLRLEVLPSLLEGGTLRLKLSLEVTELAANYDPFRGGDFAATLAGSPVKRGQLVENTILARDGEVIVLGGFTRTVEGRSHRRFPILGSVLPFLFSREVVRQSHRESLLTLTPRVVDLAAGPDETQRKLLEGR